MSWAMVGRGEGGVQIVKGVDGPAEVDETWGT
jgi:hypothetical protein